MIEIPTWVAWFGAAGALAPTAASVAAALLYRGERGEKYSPLNHFVSELGERGVSRGAALFNGGMIAGGLLMVPFFIWLALAMGTVWSMIAGAAGVWAAISCLLVGVYPMNDLTPHVRAATSFFRGGLAAVLACGLALLLSPARALPRAAASACMVAGGAYVSFLAVASIMYARRPPGTREGSFLDPRALEKRPRCWAVPALEWLVFAATVACFFALSVSAR
jgi:hypothetical membrane protein